MQLPQALHEALEQEIAACSQNELREAAMKISAHYKNSANSSSLFLSVAARLAYLTVRMPATYAAIFRALQEINFRLNWQPLSLIDLGAGPGTGGWAAIEVFPHLRSISFVEQSFPMVEIGKRLGAASPVLQKAQWFVQPLQKELPSADLALISYCVGEMPAAETKNLMERLWKSEVKVIAVIEPGTPLGYRRILEIRDWALSMGAYLVAPCPHKEACPMKAPDWCHFPARVERTRLHKLLKGGTLGYEDEKFSYIIFGKIPLDPPLGRIVGIPQKGKGFVRFPLCTEGKLKECLVSRKRESYRNARDAEWGDIWM